MAGQTIEVCGLSLNANPHPEGIYVILLRRASNALVRARGSDYAKITNPRKYDRRENIYTGRILIWTDIDVRGKWLDLSKEDEIDPTILAQINIPPNAKPNYRSFAYVFDEDSHKLRFEVKNDLGHTIGPTVVKRIFSTLFSSEIQEDETQEVEVALVPEPGALRRIIDLPRLKAITIRVGRPNPDYSSPAARQRVFRRLDAVHAQALELKFTKAAGAQRLTLTKDFVALAEVASDTGYVKGVTTDAEGHPTVVSTDDAPKKIYIEPDGGSLIARFLAGLGLKD